MPPKKAQPAQRAQAAHTPGIDVFDQMAYCSLASPDVRALQLVSQLQDQPAGVTGLLIFDGSLLIHWLEGPSQQIQSLWAQVQSDAQQHCVARLMYRPAMAKRLFAGWQIRPTNRQEMMLIIRQIKELVIKDQQNDAQALEWQHTISTLGVLLDPEFTRFYAPEQQVQQTEQTISPPSRFQEQAAC